MVIDFLMTVNMKFINLDLKHFIGQFKHAVMVQAQLLCCLYFRVYSLGALKRGEKDILVATDVAGRGIDIRLVRFTVEL